MLIRSCFETDSWIERVVANPKWERNRKMQNEAGNDAQHSKIHYAIKKKAEDPSVDFSAFAKPSRRTANEASSTMQSTNNIDGQGMSLESGEFSRPSDASGYGNAANQSADVD